MPFNPGPGTYTILPDGKRLKVWKSHVLPGSAEQAQPGQILEADSKGFHIACGTGVLAVLECQPEGKRAMAAQSFVNGQQIAVGEILS